MWRVSSSSKKTKGLKLSIVREISNLKSQFNEAHPKAPSLTASRLENNSNSHIPQIVHDEQKPSGVEYLNVCRFCNEEQESAEQLDEHIFSEHRGERPYPCYHCEKSFKKPHHRDDHVRIHTGEKPFSCELCDRRFTQPSNLRQHIKGVHLNQKRFTCRICQTEYKASHELKLHLATHEDEEDASFNSEVLLDSYPSTVTKKLTCRFCPQTYQYRRRLQAHEQTCNANLGFVCEFCSKFFGNRQVFILHAYKCSQDQPLSFDSDACANTTVDLEPEIETETEFELPELCHTDITPVEDDDNESEEFMDEDFVISSEEENSKVSFVFGDVIIEPVPSNLEAESAVDHSVEFNQCPDEGESMRVPYSKSDFQCKLCFAEFQQLPDFITHCQNHKWDYADTDATKKGEYQCRYCPRITVTRQTLKYHERTHTGEKPYICPYCKRGFARTGTLNMHIKQHTGDKPYVCQLCNKSFARASVLDVHQRSHEGKNKFRCRFCSVGFNDRRRMAAHENLYCTQRDGKHFMGFDDGETDAEIFNC